MSLSGHPELLQKLVREAHVSVDTYAMLQLSSKVLMSISCQAANSTFHSTRRSCDEPDCSVPLHGSPLFWVSSVSLSPVFGWLGRQH